MGQNPWECPIKKRKIYSKEFKLEALRQWELRRSVGSRRGLESGPSPQCAVQVERAVERARRGCVSRVGMQLKNDIALVQACLERAVAHRCPPPGLIHHTGSGATWSAQTYRQALSREGMIASMSRKGDCWDNAVSESFFGQLKNEWTYGQDYPDRDQARAALYEYMELFYNDQRLHQTLGYIPPVE